MNNHILAGIFNRMGTLLEIRGENIFKVRAYHQAADRLSQLAEDVRILRDQDRLSGIPGVGTALKDKIIEYLDSGRVSAYEKLIEAVPESLLAVVQVPNVGPRKAKLFFERLNIRDIAGLEKAALSGALAELPGIKTKTVENIVAGIRIIRQAQSYLTPAEADVMVSYIIEELKRLPQVKQIEAAGSVRRRKEAVRDIDILVAALDSGPVMDAFVSLSTVKTVQSHGPTKSSALMADGIQVDVRVVDPVCFGAALVYFTGSKNFNVRLRQAALRQGKKVNEYGVFSTAGQEETLLASDTEEACFRALGLPFIPPELREDVGLDRIFNGADPREDLRVPELIRVTDMKGDLHVHSDFSDGKSSIRDMVAGAAARGYEYVGICDHSQSLTVAGGLTPVDLLRKRAEIDRVQQAFPACRVLFGTEVEINADGGIDYDTRVLKEFDFVIAAVHTGLEQTREQMTRRLVKACRNPYVHAIAHPTGVHKGKRDAYDVDLLALFEAAAESRTFLEINAFPVRLDLNSENVYCARERGVSFVIDTDSHAVSHLSHMPYGVAVARRAWLTKEHVLNTLPLKKLLEVLKR
ncbi:MAG TPA: DNA polymerase/3'-5' exonuclease PolX [Candidatus Omnitrophota bacterium]|nr:DNA polymerase/3'-5' exonuclease PolX [Candidatus Omnitrophota bacterium]HQO58045.1 DNA polymerase/3'-5' exonuclease PolX [Candidatus Omnitrophota bacterium]